MVIDHALAVATPARDGSPKPVEIKGERPDGLL